MELKVILKELESNTGRFPREALREAIAQRERIIPALLNLLRGAQNNIDSVANSESYIAHIYSQ